MLVAEVRAIIGGMILAKAMLIVEVKAILVVSTLLVEIGVRIIPLRAKLIV